MSLWPVAAARHRAAHGRFCLQPALLASSTVCYQHCLPLIAERPLAHERQPRRQRV